MQDTQLCLTLCDPMDYTVQNSSRQNTEVDSFPLSRESFQSRHKKQVSCIAGGLSTS